MGSKSKILLIALGCLMAVAVIEQTGGLKCSFSNLVSGTGVDVARKLSSAGGLVSTLHIERPATRWLPFVKFGKTVYRRIYQERADNGVVYEHVVTTRTTLWAIGLCSTARYDELAGKPFEKAEKVYAPKKRNADAAEQD